MILKQFQNDRTGSTVNGGARTCLSHVSFQTVLQRERMRADRSGNPFALLVISPQANRLAAFAALEASLVKRLRETDAAGYLGDTQLAVLLTDTNHDGAKAFSRAIMADSEPAENLDLRVYVYPMLPNQPPSAAEPTQPRDARKTPSEDESDDHDSQAPKPALPLFSQSLPAWKRTIDVVASCLGLLILAPLFACVAAVVKLTSPGPVFFLQQRSGRGGLPFVIHKFRTMCADAEDRKAELLDQNEQDGPAFKVEHDPRLTSIGGYLRRTCLDELPQLWNVLRGDMTLVGPRPLPCEEARRCDNWQQRRLDLVPGLTCIWQVDGRRDDFSEWMRMDIRYSRRPWFWVDIKLLWRTLLKVVLHRASC